MKFTVWLTVVTLLLDLQGSGGSLLPCKNGVSFHQLRTLILLAILYSIQDIIVLFFCRFSSISFSDAILNVFLFHFLIIAC